MKKALCNKSAVSPVIAYVLLIGLAIALAMIVTVWSKQSATEQVETIVAPTAGAAECESVSINMVFNCTALDSVPKLMLYNSGSLKIAKVEIYTNPAPKSGNPLKYDAEMMPKAWAEIDPPIISAVPEIRNGMKAEVFPIISMGLENFKCQKNRVFESKVACS